MSFFRKHFKLNIILIITLVFLISLIIISKSPNNFPNGTFNVHIKRGASISNVTQDLYNKNIIRNKLLFKLSVIGLSKGNGVFAGDYRFTNSQNSFYIAYRMVKGLQDQPKVRITIPEGTNVKDMAFIYLKNLPDFNAARFLSLAYKEEGYLYPDTYNFLANVSPEEIIDTMLGNFDEKIKTINSDLNNFKKPLRDVITMASIVEKEANNMEDRRIVAGILWKRIDEGMNLQVDPPFYYITGKNTGVTYDDLKIDSPYNTYKYRGLPKGPITNPSLDAILATITPVKTKYYFYLTGDDGKMRYSITYDGHLGNKNKYIK